MAITRITGRTNPLIVQTAALHEKKYREQNHLFLLEGKKLFADALACGTSLQHIFVTEQTLPLCLSMLGITSEQDAPPSLVCLSQSAFEKISTEKSPEGIICTAEYLDKRHFFGTINRETLESLKGKRVFVLSSIRDPGNLGTVIRTACAFGVDALVLSSDCADLYHPKAVRAAMGALLRQTVYITADLPDTVTALRSIGKSVYAAMLDENAVPLPDLTLTRDTVFVVGNEGHGIDPSVAAACSGSTLIPMAKDSMESLNAAIASGILLWQSFQMNM